MGHLARVVGMGAGRVSGPWVLCRCPTLSSSVGARTWVVSGLVRSISGGSLEYMMRRGEEGLGWGPRALGDV